MWRFCVRERKGRFFRLCEPAVAGISGVEVLICVERTSVLGYREAAAHRPPSPDTVAQARHDLMKIRRLLTRTLALTWAINTAVGAAFMGGRTYYTFGFHSGKVVAVAAAGAIAWGFGFTVMGMLFDALDRKHEVEGLSVGSYGLRTLGICAVIFFVCAPVEFTFILGAGYFYDWVTGPNTAVALKIPVMLGVTVTASVLLFLFRLKARWLYGCSEAVAGFYAAYGLATSTTGNQHGPAFFFGLLTAGVYLCVRGFDNVHQGIEQGPTDWLWAWLSKMGQQGVVGNQDQ